MIWLKGRVIGKVMEAVWFNVTDLAVDKHLFSKCLLNVYYVPGTF